MSRTIRPDGALALPPADPVYRSTADISSRGRVNEADDASEVFAARRDRLVSSGRGKPLVRLAAFLAVLSHRNRNEGGDPSVIGDGLSCGFVGDLLGLSLDELELALLQLEMKGLIVPAPGLGLRITDTAGLEALADRSSGVIGRQAAPRFRRAPMRMRTTLRVETRAAPRCYVRSRDLAEDVG